MQSVMNYKDLKFKAIYERPRSVYIILGSQQQKSSLINLQHTYTHTNHPILIIYWRNCSFSTSAFDVSIECHFYVSFMHGINLLLCFVSLPFTCSHMKELQFRVHWNQNILFLSPLNSSSESVSYWDTLRYVFINDITS